MLKHQDILLHVFHYVQGHFSIFCSTTIYSIASSTNDKVDEKFSSPIFKQCYATELQWNWHCYTYQHFHQVRSVTPTKKSVLHQNFFHLACSILKYLLKNVAISCDIRCKIRLPEWICKKTLTLYLKSPDTDRFDLNKGTDHWLWDLLQTLSTINTSISESKNTWEEKEQ